MKIPYPLPLLVIALCGCARNVYDIELDPAGPSLERKLTVRQQTASSSDAPDAFHDEVLRIAEAYRAEPPAPGKMHVFRGRFAGRMPNDVGGYGTFTRWDTPLGAVAVYVERFRGNDDVAAVLQRRQATADRIADLIVAWLERELKADPNWPALRRFLNEGLRRDLNNLAIYVWTLNLPTKSEQESDGLRVLQYCVERGYLEPDDVPLINRAIADCDRGEYQRLMSWFPRLLAAGVRDSAPRWPEHLATPEGLGKSLTAFLETTDEYARLQQEWQDKLRPENEKPGGLDVATQFAVQLIYGDGAFLGGGDRLSVALKTGRPVLVTNGKWSDDSQRIQWSDQPLTRDALPPILYAAWDDPDEVGQKSRFGSVVLRGQALVEFCLWYRGLTADERDEWDALIDGLGPDSHHEQALNNFRFRHEPADRKPEHRLAHPAITAILQGLKERQ